MWPIYNMYTLKKYIYLRIDKGELKCPLSKSSQIRANKV